MRRGEGGLFSGLPASASESLRAPAQPAAAYALMSLWLAGAALPPYDPTPARRPGIRRASAATGAGVLAKVLDHYPALRIGERVAA